MLKHIEDKETNLRLAKEQEMLQSAQECDFKPSIIAPKSKKLAERARKREAARLRAQLENVDDENGGANHEETVVAALSGDVGARLTMIHKTQLRKQQQQQRIYEENVLRNAKPKIDERSQQIQRPGDVADRLYGERFRKSAIRTQLQIDQEVHSRFDKVSLLRTLRVAVSCTSCLRLA